MYPSHMLISRLPHKSRFLSPPPRGFICAKVVPLDYVAKTIDQQGMTNKNSKRMRSVS